MIYSTTACSLAMSLLTVEKHALAESCKADLSVNLSRFSPRSYVTGQATTTSTKRELLEDPEVALAPTFASKRSLNCVSHSGVDKPPQQVQNFVPFQLRPTFVCPIQERRPILIPLK